MKKTITLTAILVTLLMFGFATSSVQAATVGGAVLDARGNAVAGALVVIQQVDAPRGQRPYAARLQSDRSGHFIFDAIPGGRYVVSATTRVSAVRTQLAVRQEGAVRLRMVLPGRRGGGGERD